MENDLHKDLEPHTTLRHGTEVSYKIENFLELKIRNESWQLAAYPPSTLWKDALIWWKDPGKTGSSHLYETLSCLYN